MGPMDLASLAQLDRSHRRHDDVMSQLLDAARRLAAGRPHDTDVDVVRDAVAYFERAVTRHFLDEEGSVFPRLSTRRPDLAEALAALSAEHPAQIALQNAVAECAKQLDGESRFGVGKQLLEVAERLAELHRGHVTKEDEIFAAAGAALTVLDDADIVAEMETRRGRDSENGRDAENGRDQGGGGGRGRGMGGGGGGGAGGGRGRGMGGGGGGGGSSSSGSGRGAGAGAGQGSGGGGGGRAPTVIASPSARAKAATKSKQSAKAKPAAKSTKTTKAAAKTAAKKPAKKSIAKSAKKSAKKSIAKSAKKSVATSGKKPAKKSGKKPAKKSR